MLFVLVSATLAAVMILLHFNVLTRQREPAETNWGDLLAQLEPMDPRLQLAADRYLHPDCHQLEIEPAAMWEWVGGLEGARALRRNCKVMLTLAIYAERWNDANGRVLSEIMRRDAARITSAVNAMEQAMSSGRGLAHVGLDLQEAVAYYCLLRARLLGTYEGCHIALLPQLRASV